MKTPKEKLKEIYDEYLSWKENNKGRHFYQYLTSNKFLFVYTTLEVIKELTTHCGFSTTSECRKAIHELENKCICKIGEPYNNLCCPIHGINELENPNKHLEDSLNAIDKTIKENPEKVRKIAENVKQNWQSVSDKITDSTKNSGYTVYIPESAKKKKSDVVIYSAELENRDENTHIITWTGNNGYGQLTFKWVDNKYILDSEMLNFDTIVKILQKLQDI